MLPATTPIARCRWCAGSLLPDPDDGDPTCILCGRSAVAPRVRQPAPPNWAKLDASWESIVAREARAIAALPQRERLALRGWT